ncbi:DUF421 domain-containing protein [Epilithonimonas hominis]|uniref:Uncharacterized membrane protein YcaP, DUF421 family n=1 Tax=Epilithonimonas hominis TaxID=420404 RepID=A0A1H6K3J9_9FLAO|nr:YetF domain-containing protein [Epilithonimonas hominis]SEH67500.1 Uncharacterized membrane protein YcaP, DUF421 family [Epilithonimonas hominis]
MLDFKQILLGSEDWSFLLETVLRTSIMFVIIILGLRLLGKRGVKQLSVFELVVIIGLGSAAGDPMFYKDVGIIPAIVVFTMIISLYSIITYFIGKSKKFENLVEGKPICLINEGVFCIDDFKKESLGEDEFFAELRLKGVSHLGQIEKAIEEISGEISVFYYEDKDIKYGLPIMPGSLDNVIKLIAVKKHYSCKFCGFTEELNNGKHNCKVCGKDEWVESSNKKRIS